MSSLNRFIEPTKDYINFKDLLIHLSEMNNKPLYEVVNYLLCCDFDKLGFYHIDSKYRIIPVSFDKKDIINQVLNILKEVIRLGDINDEHWIYTNDDSLELFSHGTGDKIAKLIESLASFYFNKKELLNFGLLKDLLHLDAHYDEPMPNDNQRIIEMQERVDELLNELIDKEEYEHLTPIQKHTLYLKKIALPLAQKIWSFDRETNLLMRKQVARLVVELLPNFNLRESQVDGWLKNSELVPTAITDRCAQQDYGRTTPEKEQREVIKNKIRSEIAFKIPSFTESTPKF